MNASIHDVAKRAGVSIATVSRVVNNSAGVKESKVAAVKEALEYYDYQPSQFGRGTCNRHFQNDWCLFTISRWGKHV